MIYNIYQDCIYIVVYIPYFCNEEDHCYLFSYIPEPLPSHFHNLVREFMLRINITKLEQNFQYYGLLVENNAIIGEMSRILLDSDKSY